MAIFTPNKTARASQGRFSSILPPPTGKVYAAGEVGMPVCFFHFRVILEAEKAKEENAVIKGINKRVVVVRSPDRRFFEEAIFIVKEGVTGVPGVTAQQVVEEARRVADGYVRKHTSKWYQRIPAAGYMAIGALASSAAWAAAMFL